MGRMWQEIDTFLRRHLSPAVRWIVLINVALFLLSAILTPFLDVAQLFFFLLMETPALAVGQVFLWQFVSYMFMHATFGHLFFNMLMLGFFGPRLEYRWGTPRFLRFYLICGLGAGIFHAIMSYLMGRADQTMLGASGALYGVFLAYAVCWPDDTVLLYFVLPIKMKYLIVLLGVASFLFSIPGAASGNISHITHLGGLLVGILLLYVAHLRGGGSRPPRPPAGGWHRRVRIVRVNPARHPDFR